MLFHSTHIGLASPIVGEQGAESIPAKLTGLWLSSVSSTASAVLCIRMSLTSNSNPYMFILKRFENLFRKFIDTHWPLAETSTGI